MTLNRCVAPEVRDFTVMKLAPVEERIVAGGIRLVTLGDPGCEDLCRLVVSLPGGSVECAQPALASLAVAQLREGSAEWSGEQIADMIDYSGAKLSNSAWQHVRTLSMTVLNSQLPATLPLLEEIILRPSFPPEVFAHNARRLAANLTVARERNSFLATELSEKVTFGKDSPLARPYSPELTAELTAADAHAFHNTWRAADGTTVYAVGRLDRKVSDMVEGFCERLAAGMPGHGPTLDVVRPTTLTGCERFDMSGEVRNQAAIQLNIPLPDSSATGFLNLLFAVKLLGGFFGSRLMSNIREEKGYSYGISASVLRLREGNFLRVATECDRSYVKDVLREINAEIEGLVSREASAEEMTRMKRHARSVKASALESIFTQMNFRISCEANLIDPAEFEQQQIALERLTARDLSEAARRWLVEAPRRLVVVGA